MSLVVPPLVPVPEPPDNVTAESPNSTSISVMWTPPTVKNGILLRYEVLYKQTSNTCSFDGSAIDGNVTTMMQSIVITGLAKFKEYCVFVRAYTSAGPGDPAHTKVTTDPDSE